MPGQPRHDSLNTPPVFDILVAGEINPDLILSGDVVPEFGQIEKLVDSAALTIGSSSAIFACGAARLGLSVAFTGFCGDDIWGHFMLDEISRRGVDVSHVIKVPGGQTGLSVILTRGNDRAILTFPGLISAIKAEDIPDSLLAQARHLHVASYFIQDALQPGLPGLFRRSHALGLTNSLDTNWDPTGAWRGLDGLLPLVDVFLPNENEVKAITHKPDVDLALEAISKLVPLTVVKRGAAGASLRSDGQMISVESIPVNLVDTVGAGDSFNAGFLYGYLKHWPLEKSLRMGAVCGALSTQAAGGTTAQPTLEETLPHAG